MAQEASPVRRRSGSIQPRRFALPGSEVYAEALHSPAVVAATLDDIADDSGNYEVVLATPTLSDRSCRRIGRGEVAEVARDVDQMGLVNGSNEFGSSTFPMTASGER